MKRMSPHRFAMSWPLKRVALALPDVQELVPLFMRREILPACSVNVRICPSPKLRLVRREIRGLTWRFTGLAWVVF